VPRIKSILVMFSRSWIYLVIAYYIILDVHPDASWHVGEVDGRPEKTGV